MPLLTVARYRTITGDTNTPPETVTARIEEATGLIEEQALNGRPLESQERTDSLPVSRWRRVYPPATPITAIVGGVNYLIEDTATISNVTPDDPIYQWGWADGDERSPGNQPTATVTYTGGYTDVTVPTTIARHIALLAQALNPSHSPSLDRSRIPAGAVSVSVGDASVTFDSALHGVDELVPGTVNALRRWRRRR